MGDRAAEAFAILWLIGRAGREVWDDVGHCGVAHHFSF